MSEDQLTLSTLMSRLKRFHPRHETELSIVEYLLHEHGVTDTVFEEVLGRHRKVTNRLRGVT